MSSVASPPNPCLVGIVLVVQSRIGQSSQIVFHYPPEPLDHAEAQARQQNVAVLDPFSSSDSDESSSSEDDLNILNKSLKQTKSNGSSRFRHADEDDEINLTTSTQRDDRPWVPSWEPLLGFGEDGLVSLLTPGRAWHKTRFEMSINDLTFVGRPVYAREDGMWRKIKKDDYDDTSGDEEEKSVLDDPPSHAKAYNDQSDKQMIAASQSLSHTHPVPEKSQLTMFHVVFVLNPSSLEHQPRVQDMYDNVVKKFSKVLKHEQAHSDYVLEQVEIIQNIKMRHISTHSSTTDLYGEVLNKSTLAAAIADIFSTISTSHIAVVTLGSRKQISLQIPPTTSTAYLPSLNDPPIQPGLWLTTADDWTSPTDLDSTAPLTPVQAAKCLTLLLKTTPQKMLKDIAASGGLLDPTLAQFVNRINPSKSFYKTSVEAKMSLQNIQFLARHLIYWRRAVAIPPLHHRDTYIVSPNADLGRLKEASRNFETIFPMMPSLPQILSILSEIPMPYQKLIPSPDHKDEYYKVLAWLMRDGWVTQLRTFAFVRVSPEIKKGAREQDRRSPVAIERMMKEATEHSPTESTKQAASSSNVNKDERSSQQFRRPTLPSHRSSERQSISASSTDGRDSSGQENSKHASLILSPLRATPRESKWLEYIRDQFSAENLANVGAQSMGSTATSNNDTEDLGKSWATTVKHFNGIEPLERIAMRENLKRKMVWDRLSRFGLRFKGGVEREDGQNAGVLVTVRHW